jgi:ribonucleoside-diphosphate reductase alpha chain
MMAAAQPFISGAISKTINLPNSATREDIAAAYRLSWELGLKANALYRDGCKLSQPLSTKSSDRDAARDDDKAGRETDVRLLRLDDDEDHEGVESAREEVTVEMGRLGAAMVEGKERVVEKVVERIVHRPMRRRLPDTRQSLTHKFNVAGHEGYLTVGLYEDGAPGELFITMSKEGSTIGGLMDSLGTATSVALQYGVPIDSLVRKFTHQRFEPAGITANRDIPIAKSLVDYIFRWLGIEFVPGYREQVVPRRGGDAKPEGERSGDSAAARTTADRVVRIDAGRRDIGGGGGGNGSGAGSGGGNGAGVSAVVSEKSRTRVVVAAETETARLATGPRDALSSSLAEFQEDAPACEVCGTITVRNGTCYRCMNCGNSMGCS